jgi:3'-5' exonuclease
LGGSGRLDTRLDTPLSIKRRHPDSRIAHGGEVEKFHREGRIREIAEYCESDVVNTYRVWLRYELFRGRLTDAEYQASEACLVDFIKARGNTKPHLADLA